MSGTLFHRDVTISSGTSLSDAVHLQDAAIVGIHFSAAWTAADLTFEAAPAEDDLSEPASGDYQDVYDQFGSEVTVTEPTGGFADVFVAIEPQAFAGMEWVKLRSGTSGSATNQGADRVLKVALKVV